MVSQPFNEDHLRRLLDPGHTSEANAESLIQSTVHRAHRYLGVRNVLSLIFGRIWLALLALFAPMISRLHRHLAVQNTFRRN